MTPILATITPSLSGFFWSLALGAIIVVIPAAGLLFFLSQNDKITRT